jgi:pSer/pThr/pTyr-binding forkhead associated (FHA) protein
MAVKTTLAFEDEDEPRRIVKWVTEPTHAPEDRQDFRPSLRPPVPILTVLDDGSMEQGEDVRVRHETLRIGRTRGDVQIPNDWAVSGAHAEIRRTPWKGGYQWHLHDLDSVNGTFVRCVRAVLHENAILILGARRFRLANPLKPNNVPLAGRDTHDMDGMHIPPIVWPVLLEASGKPGALECPLRSDRLVIGRTGGGADIELDDPLLAHQHAELKRMRDGTWIIVSETTRNGIWVSISAVGLSPNCYFRCGEQRFRFVIP